MLQSEVHQPGSQGRPSSPIEDSALLMLSAACILAVSLHVLANAYYGVIEYDMGKLISYLPRNATFLDYVADVRFGQGMAAQYYLLGSVITLTAPILKTLSYLFFMSSFVLTVVQVRYQSDITLRFCITALLSASCFVFLNSKLLAYLGSYGMLVYCQMFLAGALLLYFTRRVLLSDQSVTFAAQWKWVSLWCLVTFLDIRFSYFLSVAFFVSLLYHAGNTQLLKDRFIFGLITAAAITPPILLQFSLYADVMGFKPGHVTPMLYGGDLLNPDSASFLADRSRQFLTTLFGEGPWTKAAILSLMVAGTLSPSMPQNRWIAALVALSMAPISLAALFGVYPYGSIRYTTPLLAPIAYLYISGVYTLTLLLVESTLERRIKVAAVLAITGILLAHALQQSLMGLAKEQDTYQREELIIRQIETADEGRIWCDIATQKIVEAYGRSCNVITTWVFMSGVPESEEFYEEVLHPLQRHNSQPLTLLLLKSIETPAFSRLKSHLNTEGFRQETYTYGRATHMYIYRPI